MHRKDVFKQYFTFRCIPVWNILPDHYFNTNVIESFELKLTKTDFSQFLYGTLYKRELPLVYSLLIAYFYVCMLYFLPITNFYYYYYIAYFI